MKAIIKTPGKDNRPVLKLNDILDNEGIYCPTKNRHIRLITIMEDEDRKVTLVCFDTFIEIHDGRSWINEEFYKVDESIEIIFSNKN